MEGVIEEQEALLVDPLLEKVYRQGGYDFRDYKRTTITRRLEGRLHAIGAKSYPEYMRFLDAHPEEYQSLAEYLTIKASGFFRVPYTFQRVAELVLPELLHCKQARGERRVSFWSAACARGEEPYSIAMMLTEFLGQRRQGFDISIHATDISRWALSRAQAGIYSLQDVEGLTGNILEKYFRRAEDYEVRADIRQMVKFSHFDLTSKDTPPLENADCIFCCNVLIYWQRHLQERVLDMLYDSLAAPGYLVLGEVEMLPNRVRDKLECLDHKAKIYKKAAG